MKGSGFIIIPALCVPIYSLGHGLMMSEMGNVEVARRVYQIAFPDSPYATFRVINLVASVSVSYLSFVTLRKLGLRLGRHSFPDVPEPISIPAPSPLIDELSLHLGYQPQREQWVRIPEKGCFGNIAIFGGIGSGKTASLIYPLLEEMITYRSESKRLKMAGLLLQVKSDFNERVMQIARECGRGEDVVILGLDKRYTWNPIHVPEMEPESLAGRLVAVYENLVSGKQQGASWVASGILKLLTHGIGLHRTTYGYVTIKDVAELLRKSSDMNSPKCPCKVLVKRYREVFEKRGATEEEIRAFQYHASYFTDEWANENEKNRGTLLGAVSDVIGVFTNPKIAEVFCPDEKEITFEGFHQIIETGKIVCLGLDSANHGILATIIGILLKLEFQRASLARIEKEKGSNRPKRNLLFVCDEYQEFVTAGSSRGIQGDNDFFAQARQSQVISCIATQGIVTMISKVGKEKAEETLNSIRTKVFLTLIDPDDRKRASEICGKKKVMKETTTFSESPNKTKKVFGYTLSRGSKVQESRAFSENEEYYFSPSRFGSLATFEAIATVFDGVEQRKPEYIETKPYFARDKRHNEILKMLKGEE